MLKRVLFHRLFNRLILLSVMIAGNAMLASDNKVSADAWPCPPNPPSACTINCPLGQTCIWYQVWKDAKCYWKSRCVLDDLR